MLFLLLDVLHVCLVTLGSAPFAPIEYITLILVRLDFNKTFELECDPSGIGLGGVLLQDGKPVAYFSEKLSGPSLNYSTYDKELY